MRHALYTMNFSKPVKVMQQTYLITRRIQNQSWCGRTAATVGTHYKPSKLCNNTHFAPQYTKNQVKTKPVWNSHTYHRGYCFESHPAVPTVYAVSSGHGKCGVCVIRVSGPRAPDIVRAVWGKPKLPEPRTAVLASFRHPVTRHTIDKGLLLWFPGPASFTGEDSCEFQVHGGIAVVSAMLDAIATVPGTRPAEPGDFTKRAFQNGKLDLTQVEGLGDLIHAETEAQHQQALRQMQGDLRDLYGQWRKQILQSVANVEAYIDFSEDDNIEDDVLSVVSSQVTELRVEILAHLRDHRQGERLRSGVRVAIIGDPNVGKSSLLNAITQRPAAIVSPVAGTTRDVVETAVNIGGYPALLSDTAGLRETRDIVEKEGVRRALERASDADLIVLVLDAEKLAPISGRDLNQILRQHLQTLGLITEKVTNENNQEIILDPAVPGATSRTIPNDRHRQSVHDSVLHEHSDDSFNLSDMIVVFNKCDLVGNIDALQEGCDWQCCQLSCITGYGMEEFLDVLAEKLKLLCGNPSVGSPSLTQARHRTHLQACLEALDTYDRFTNQDLVLAAHYLRQALWQIGKITGTVEPEEILDVIFRDFCIGK